MDTTLTEDSSPITAHIPIARTQSLMITNTSYNLAQNSLLLIKAKLEQSLVKAMSL
tara:strand:- start:1299 stop:1466 length:168 start_codon:yes stop_codon:yes gene_type:complete